MQLAGSRAEEEVADGQAREGRERIEQLERDLKDSRREVARLRGQLTATEQVVTQILKKNLNFIFFNDFFILLILYIVSQQKVIATACNITFSVM